jgi:hypothetical protein
VTSPSNFKICTVSFLFSLEFKWHFYWQCIERFITIFDSYQYFSDNYDVLYFVFLDLPSPFFLSNVMMQPKKVMSFEDAKQRASQWKKAIEGLQNRWTHSGFKSIFF